jgi:hypothetical protein
VTASDPSNDLKTVVLYYTPYGATQTKLSLSISGSFWVGTIDNTTMPAIPVGIVPIVYTMPWHVVATDAAGGSATWDSSSGPVVQETAC